MRKMESSPVLTCQNPGHVILSAVPSMKSQCYHSLTHNNNNTTLLFLLVLSTIIFWLVVVVVALVVGVGPGGSACQGTHTPCYVVLPW